MLSDEEKKKYEEIKYNNGYLYCDKEDVDCLIDIIEKQSKEIEELNIKILSNAGIYQLGFNDGEKKVKDKIKAKIEELEKEQEDNRKVLYNAVNNLDFKEIDIISDKISVNMSIREVLQSLLEKE